MEDTSENFATKVVKRTQIKGPVEPLSLPIFATSTYQLDSAEHGAALSELEEMEGKSPWLYTRWGNPTTNAVANTVNKLEKGYGSFVLASGMAAVSTTLLGLLKGGDHVLVLEPVYGGTHEMFEKVLPNYGVEIEFILDNDYKKLESSIKSSTKMIYCESPANPNMNITDLAIVGNLAKKYNIDAVIDSTFASPYNQNPIDYGFTVVIHSATKYLGGHSDITAGTITVNNERLHKQIFQQLKLLGGILSPFEAFLLARGIQSLDVRMERHNNNALKVAQFLDNHEKIQKVYYPGLVSHPQHEIANKQMRGYSGMIAFEVKGGVESAKKVIENLKIIVLAVSLGGVESLIEHAASMTHTMVARETRIRSGITDGLIRFSVGLENPDDLIADLDQALRLI